MGFIGFKNRNLPLFFSSPVDALSHNTYTHTHTLSSIDMCMHTQTHTHWTRGQTGWPAEWVCAVVMIGLLNGAVLCHASCWARGLTERNLINIQSLSLSLCLSVWLSLPLCLSLFMSFSLCFFFVFIFYHSCHCSLSQWINLLALKKYYLYHIHRHCFPLYKQCFKEISVQMQNAITQLECCQENA